MATVRIGLITIGQAPRDDVVPDMLAQLPFDVEPLQCGAVDGLSLNEVKGLAPRYGEPWSVSRMQDGTEVRLAKRELIPRMQQRVHELEDQGVDLIVPLCASDWSALECRVPFINPGGALPAIIRAMLRPGGTLGAVSPTEAQAELANERYAREGLPAVSTFAQPYTDADERRRQCAAAGELLAKRGVDLIYMGCMGHNQEMRAIVREVSGRPTVTSNGIITGLIAQAMA
jgi:protein AroM